MLSNFLRKVPLFGIYRKILLLFLLLPGARFQNALLKLTGAGLFQTFVMFNLKKQTIQPPFSVILKCKIHFRQAKTNLS